VFGVLQKALYKVNAVWVAPGEIVFKNFDVKLWLLALVQNFF
jgi:hypothetical protein